MAVHFSIEELANNLKIKIRHTKRSEIPVIIFLLIWLVGWGFGETFALVSLFAPDTPWPVRGFFIIWVIPWTIGGGFAMLSVLKMLGGRELVEVGRGLLKVTRTFVFFKFAKQYDIFKISDLHALNKNPRKHYLFNSGVIQFLYEEKDVRFGSGLSNSEKIEVMKRMREHRDFNERNFATS